MRKFIITLCGILLTMLLTQCPFTMEPREYSFCILNNYSGKGLVAVVSTEYPNTFHPSKYDYHPLLIMGICSNEILTYKNREDLFNKNHIIIILLYDMDEYFDTPIELLQKERKEVACYKLTMDYMIEHNWTLTYPIVEQQDTEQPSSIQVNNHLSKKSE